MSININDDRRLRVTWLKYQNIINDMKKYAQKKEFIQNKVDVNGLSRWEAGLAFDEEIKKIEQQRREEMNVIRKTMNTERKQQEEQDKIREQEETRKKTALLEERRQTRELRKAELPHYVRRSARVHSKTSNDPLISYKRGSMYTKTA